jgi:hypothetical protein
LIGDRLSHYRALGQIGAGGMDLVYRARDEQLVVIARKAAKANET